MTLDEIRASSTIGAFPHEAAKGCRSAAVFFCAAFLGKNDAIHLFDAGVEVALLVDADLEKLVEMRPYLAAREGWAIRHADAFATARNLADVGRQFDVVTVDPWTQHQPEVLRRLDLFAALASRVLIVGASDAWARENDVPHAEGMLFLRAHKRSDHAGGQSWLIYRKEPK